MPDNVVGEERDRSARERRGGDPFAIRLVQPDHGVGLVAGEHDGRTRLERDAHHSRRGKSLQAHLVGQRVGHQAACTVADACHRDAVGNQLLLLVVCAADLPAVVALPPLIEHHAVHGGHRAGADAGVAGAGHGVVVGIVRLPEPRALRNQPLESLRPLVLKAIDVVAAHLVDGEQDDELRPRPAGSV